MDKVYRLNYVVLLKIQGSYKSRVSVFFPLVLIYLYKYKCLSVCVCVCVMFADIFFITASIAFMSNVFVLFCKLYIIIIAVIIGIIAYLTHWNFFGNERFWELV